MTDVFIEVNRLTEKNKDHVTMFIIIVLALFYPLLAFPISLYVIYHKKNLWRVCIFAMSIFFAAIAYSFTPTWENDLVRYWAIVQQKTSLDFSKAMFSTHGDVKLYLFNFMAWLTGHMDDLHVLPAISTYVVYFTSFYITCCIGEKTGKDWKYTFRYLVFIMCFLNLYEVTETVRCIMAFSMAEAAVFRDIYIGKKDLKTLALYILPIFLHPMAALFLAIRLVLGLTSKLKIFLLLIIALINPIVNWVYVNFAGVINISVINTIITKAYLYLINNTNAWGLAIQGSKYYNTRKIIYISFTILICIYFLSNVYMNRKYPSEYAIDKKTRKIQNFSFMIILMALICMNTLTGEYWRFVSALVIIGGIFYIPYAEGIVYRKNSSLIKLLSYVLCVFGVVLSLHFFYAIDINCVKNLLSTMTHTCPAFIAIKDLLNFIGI